MRVRYSLRAYQRFPVKCSLHYMGPEFLGEGIARNVSRMGWRVEGDSPVQAGTVLTASLLPPGQSVPIKVDQAIVRWSKGRTFGIRVLTMKAEEAARLNHLIMTLVQQHLGNSPIPHALPG